MSSEKPNTVGKRIQFIRTHFGLNKKQFAERLDISDSYVSFLESNKRTKISDQLGHSIAYKFGVNPVWVLVGEGEIFRSCPSAIERPPIPGDVAQVPLYFAEASAGGGAIAETEEIKEYIQFKASWIRGDLRAVPANLFMLKVTGDSMEPTLRAGDLLLVDKAEQLRDSGIYVVRIGDFTLVKRIKIAPGPKLLIISDNAERYGPDTVDPKNLGELNIDVLGRVIWHGRNL
jgi:phage repressor protein C with HTH and peptisase S24 domain